MRPHNFLSRFATVLLVALFVPVAGQAQTATGSANVNALLERQQLQAMGSIDDWSCSTVSDISTRVGRLAYVWSVGYVTGRLYPNMKGSDWRESTSASNAGFAFDESMVDAVQGYCLLNPDDHLGEMRFTARQEVAMGRLFKILSSYRWQDIALVQQESAIDSSRLTHRARSVMMDGFIAGQLTATRTADQIVKQGSAPWMCDAYEAMAANPALHLREAALAFFAQPANAVYHQASCARANYLVLDAAGQIDRTLLQRARSAGQIISLPQAIDPGPEF